MNEIKQDCFALVKKKDTLECYCLKELKCFECSFYKNNTEISRREIEHAVNAYNPVKG